MPSHGDRRHTARAFAVAAWVPLVSDAAMHNLPMWCPSRFCLPEDTSRSEGTLCYTNTGTSQAFAQCPDSENLSCEMCTTTPPCESWCEEDRYEPKRIGETCHLDRECKHKASGYFAACHLGMCQHVKWPGQLCDPNDEDSICLFGAQRCVEGRCVGLGTNEPCWDGYSDGLDLDCKSGWYCLNMICVPQLPAGHTCYGGHPDECLRGHRCNLSGDRPQCVAEYSLPDGVLSSDTRLCYSSHIDPRSGECNQYPPTDAGGSDCYTDEDCTRSDGSIGDCACKEWWDGNGAPGFCQLAVPDVEKPAFMELWQLRKEFCHHNWPDDRCAYELEEPSLLTRVIQERQATSDPTEVPKCAHELLGILVWSSARRRTLSALLATAVGLCAVRHGAW
eukprot:gnl/TRDRNA2_/TRDRNA2_84356_c0_seq1.p1 gnl/TRDRNA2_/TRDRNA2_84356_c0~~gnl/TRDRNA2_/TRDRNA2_84356_c0_seq1.p1  ORF type:complete len:391 (-),score=27.35 gnl/TRDRNA2_/TRDRNA2_84356_c0_seq1:34-1206(-)